MLHTQHDANWKELLANSIVSAHELADRLPLDSETIGNIIKVYPMRINPYFLKLALRRPNGPIWRQVIPDVAEIDDDSENRTNLIPDPLSEEQQSPVPDLIHRYPDRVLFLVTHKCAVYCRFCMRKRLVGTFNESHQNRSQAFDYIKSNPQIREVILSGGDPLILDDSVIEDLLSRIRKINHVEILRVHTRIPCTLPQRVTANLVSILKKHGPVFVNIHFNHPDEITPESSLACNMLADAGIPLGSQTVLLKGINDQGNIIKTLMQDLTRMRIRPYYLHHPDLVQGTHHFRCPIKNGLEIVKSLYGHISGICIPHYMIDLPGGGGKTPLLPDYVEEETPDHICVRNYQGRPFVFPAR